MMKLYLLFLCFTCGFAQTHCYRGMVLHFKSSPYVDDGTVDGEKSCLEAMNAGGTPDPNTPGGAATIATAKQCILKAHINAARFFKDGLLVVNPDGTVNSVGKYDSAVNCSTTADYSGYLISPGFIDCHNHWAQLDIMGSVAGDFHSSERVYNSHSRFGKEAGKAHAQQQARKFFNALARSGTTSGLVFNVIFQEAVKEFFAEATRRKMHIVSGLSGVSNCGELYSKDNIPLCNSLDEADVFGIVSAAKFFNESIELIQAHHNDKQRVAVVVGSLFDSTPALLEKCVELTNNSELLFHSHLSEDVSYSRLEAWLNKYEVWYSATGLFHQQPEADRTAFLSAVNANTADDFRTRLLACHTELEVFAEYGLVSPRSVFAHSVHMTESDIETVASLQAKPCHCPSSDLIAGKGFFPIEQFVREGVEFGIGTDVGSGTSFEQLRSLSDMYKVGVSNGETSCNLPASLDSDVRALLGDGDLCSQTHDKEYVIKQKTAYASHSLGQMYQITLGTAISLDLDARVGNFEPGKVADFVVIDTLFSPLLKQIAASEIVLPDITNYADVSWLTEADLNNIYHLIEDIFPLIMLSNDRSILATYIDGKKVYDRNVNYDAELHETFAFNHLYEPDRPPMEIDNEQLTAQNQQLTESNTILENTKQQLEQNNLDLEAEKSAALEDVAELTKTNAKLSDRVGVLEQDYTTSPAVVILGVLVCLVGMVAIIAIVLLVITHKRHKASAHVDKIRGI